MTETNPDTRDLLATIAGLRQKLERVTQERQELSDYAFEATKAITGLTAGGSEYFAGKLSDGRYKADLSFCVHRIRERYQREAEAHRKQLSRAERAEAENARLREALTPSADTKAAYEGSVSTGVVMRLGRQEERRSVAVSWEAIRQMMAMISARAARQATEEKNDG